MSGVLNPGSGITITYTGSTLTVLASGTLKVNASTFGGNYSGGTTTLNAGSVVDYSGTTQTVSNALTYSTLTISGSGVKTLAGNLTALQSSTAAVGNIYITAGTLDLSTFTANRGVTVAGGAITVFNGATLRIGGTNSMPTNYATRSFSLTSTVEYAGGAQTVSAESYGNLSLSSSSGSVSKTMPATAFIVYNNFTSSIGSGTGVSFTSGSNISFLGNVTIGASTTFNGSTHSHTIAGSLSNSGTITGATGTITMTGSAQSISGSGTFNFNNLSITGSAITASASSALNVGGNLIVSGGGSFSHSSNGTLTMSGTGKTIQGSNLTLNNLTISGTISSSATFDLIGNLVVSGSLASPSGQLTMSGSSKTISGAGSIGFFILEISGSVVTSSSFSIGSGLTVAGVGASFTANAGEATFTGTSTLSGTANLNQVRINGTSLTLGTNSTLGIASTFTLTSGTLDASSTTPNTVDFNGSGAQNINGLTYHNLIISNTNTKTAAGAITANGNLTIGTGATFNAGAFTHSILGNFIVSGNFTAATSTIQFTGVNDVSITGTPTFHILTINKSSSYNRITLLGNISTPTLNMTNGMLFTGNNSITITSSRGGNGIIIGNITRTHAFAASTAYAFEGPNNTITISGANTLSSITVSVKLEPVADFPFGGAINRYYNISATGTLSASTATLRLHYEDNELNGNGEATADIWRYSGTWASVSKSSNNTTDNYIELAGLVSLSHRWTISDDNNVVKWNGSISSEWNNASNWTIIQGAPTLPPTFNEIVQIGTDAFGNQPIISSAAQAKSIIFGSSQAVTLTISSGSLTTSGNISGTWSGNATHSLVVGANSLVVGGDLTLSDGTANHVINLSAGSGTVTVSGNLNESGGANITFSGSGTLSIAKDFVYVSGTFTPSTSTVVYNGGNNQVVAGLGYHHLTINKSAGHGTLGTEAQVSGNLTLSSGHLDLNAALTVVGNLTLSSGTSLTMVEVTLKVGGNWINTGGTLLPGLGTVELNGSGSQTIDPTSFAILTVNKSAGEASLTGNIIINRSLTLSSGTLVLSTFTANRSVLGGTLTLGSGTLLTLSGASNFPANFALNNLNASSTTHYNGTVAQSVTGGITYGHLILSNGGANVKTLAGSITVGGNLTINSGATFNASAYTLSLNGNWTTSGTFVPAASTVNLTGSSKLIEGATAFNRLNISGSYSVSSGNQVSVDTSVVIVNGGSFDSGSGIYTIHGDFIVYGTYTGAGVITYTGLKQQRGAVYAGSTFSAGGTFNFNGNIAPLFTSTSNPTFNNVNINNTGGVTASVPWLVNGSFSIGNGASFNGGIYSHTFRGNFTNNGTITSSGVLYFNPSSAAAIQLNGTAFTSTGTVNLGGSGQLTLTGAFNTLTNLIISNTHASGVTPPSGWTVGGLMSIANGTTFNALTFSYSVAGNFECDGTLNGGTSTFTLSSAAMEMSGSPGTTFHHLTITGSRTANSRFYVSGNFVNNGTFDVTQGEIIFSGSGNTTISGSTTPTTLGNIGVEKTNASVTMAVNVSGVLDLQVRTGTFACSTFTLTQDAGALSVFNNATFSIAGNNAMPTFTSYFFDTSSTVIYAGGTQSISAPANYGNLTISATGNQTATDTLTILGNFTLSGGTFIGGNFPHSVSKNWNMSGGTFTNTNTTILLNGTANQTVTSTGAFNHLTINKSAGTTTLGSDITVGGTLALTAGLIDASSFTLIVSNSQTTAITRTTGWVKGNLRRGILGTGNLTYTFPIGDETNYTPVSLAFTSLSGVGTITANVTNTEHPNISSSNLNSSRSVNRYYTLTNSNTTFTSYAPTFTFVAGDLDGGVTTSNLRIAKYSGGTWTLPTTSGNTATTTTASGLTAFSDFIIAEQLTKVWDGGAATLNWNDGANWNPDGVPSTLNLVTITANSGTVVVNTAAVAKNLTLNNASGFGIQISSGNSLTVSDTLTLSSANIDINGQSLTLNGVLASTGTGSITGSNASNLTIGGSGAFGSLRMNQTSSGTTNRLNNLTINRTGSGTVSLNDSLQIIGVLTATEGTLTTAGKLTLAATSSTVYGQLSGSGNGTVSGNTRVMRVMANTNAGWRQISLPTQSMIGNVSGLKIQGVSNLVESQRNAFRWNAALNGNFAYGWTSADSTENNTYGYIIYSNNSYPALHGLSSTISSYGELVQSSYTIPIPNTRDTNGMNDTPDEYGWNLIPNRFASNLDISDLLIDVDFQSGYKAVHVWDNVNSQYVGINSSTLIQYNSIQSLDVSTNIAPWQAFWVKADGNGQSITVKKAHRTTSMSNVSVFMKSNPDFLRLNVSDGKGRKDQVAVMFDFEATQGFDGDKDLYKLKSYNRDVPTLLIKEGSYQLSASALPYQDSTAVQLEFQSRFHGETYTFDAWLNSLSYGGEVWLEDRKTKIFTNLRNSGYSFQHDLDFTDRFVLHFYGKTSTISQEISNSKVITYSSGGEINIQARTTELSGATVTITNVLGQVLYTDRLLDEKPLGFRPKSSVPQVYFITLWHGNQKLTVKHYHDPSH